jgi:hypothetical protein
VPLHLGVGVLLQERLGHDKGGHKLGAREVVARLAVLPQAPYQAHPDGLVVVARCVAPHGLQPAGAVDGPLPVDDEVVADAKEPLPAPLPAQHVNRP